MNSREFDLLYAHIEHVNVKLDALRFSIFTTLRQRNEKAANDFDEMFIAAFKGQVELRKENLLQENPDAAELFLDMTQFENR